VRYTVIRQHSSQRGSISRLAKHERPRGANDPVKENRLPHREFNRSKAAERRE